MLTTILVALIKEKRRKLFFKWTVERVISVALSDPFIGISTHEKTIREHHDFSCFMGQETARLDNILEETNDYIVT